MNGLSGRKKSIGSAVRHWHRIMAHHAIGFPTGYHQRRLPKDTLNLASFMRTPSIRIDHRPLIILLICFLPWGAAPAQESPAKDAERRFRLALTPFRRRSKAGPSTSSHPSRRIQRDVRHCACSPTTPPHQHPCPQSSAGTHASARNMD